MRCYITDDIIGTQIAGAIKNIIAVAAGITDGLNMGVNIRSALITRGLREMSLFGLASGANPTRFCLLQALVI